MKRPKPEIANSIQNKFINNVSTPRKLKRLWGTSMVNGVEVMDYRKLYYPESARPENFDKLFKFLGVYDDTTTANMEGINDAWIYLNRHKLSGTSVLLTPFVTSNLNKIRDNGLDGTYLTTRINIGTLRFDYDDYNESSIIDRDMDEETLISTIRNNYTELFETCIIEHTGYSTVVKTIQSLDVNNDPIFDLEGNPVLEQVKEYLHTDDPWVTSIAINSLLNDNEDVEILRCFKELVEVPPPKFGSGKRGREEAYNYRTKYRVRYAVELKIPLVTFSSSSDIVTVTVDQIQNDYSDYVPIITGRGKEGVTYNVAKPNGLVVKSRIQSDLALIDNFLSEEDHPVTLLLRDYENWLDFTQTLSSTLDHLWVNDGKYDFLKADVLYRPSNYGLKFSELNKYLEDIMDSGYGKKSVPVWKKIIAIVIFVVVVIFTRSAQGASWAMSVIIGSLALTLISLALSELGEQEWAMAIAEANSIIEPLVTVANVYLLFTGVSELYSQAQQTVATEAGTTVSEVTLNQTIGQLISGSADGMVSTLLQGARDIASGNIVSNAAMQFTTTMFKLGNMVQQQKLEKVSNRIRDLASEYEDLTKEMSQERDLLKGFAKVYGKPATADWSIYAEQFDLPYERGGGPLSLGNIQRTTKQAIRKGKYNDLVFENILVV